MIPRELKKYFWDVDTDKLDIKTYPEYVILRVLEYGDATALRWLFRNFKKSDFKKVLTKRRGISAKTANYWGLILGIPRNKILCLRKQYQDKRQKIWRF
ncbi:MAG: hypothetical protein ABIJ28_04285 [Patescibacteria group bacterium]|nr:hypothetical protein [Patescibacteria group bacterium]